MSTYTEDKKIRERLTASLLSLCKQHGYEPDEEDRKKLKRMKTFELCEFSSKLLTRLNQRRHEVFMKDLEKTRQVIAKFLGKGGA